MIVSCVFILIAIVGVFTIPKLGLNNSKDVYAEDLMKNITAKNIHNKNINNNFINSYCDFSVDLFKNSINYVDNFLISPTSVYLALAMTSNGAEKDTLKEFESLLGGSGVDLSNINENANSMINRFTEEDESKVSIANSIWYRDETSLKVNNEFLEVNGQYYGSDIYKADFNSNDTIDDINNWVKKGTNGLIDKIVEHIDNDTIMYLINTLYFEGQWDTPYEENQISKKEFTNSKNEKQKVEFMFSRENKYIENVNSRGFIKPYMGNKYSFVALLPNKGISIEEYVATLDGGEYLNLINNVADEGVMVKIPKFTSEYELELNDILKKMGLQEAFNVEKANFSKMATSSYGNIYIGNVLHKTHIQVDIWGTKAGAATKVEMKSESAVMEPPKQVFLDRPFIYGIIDNETGMPLFLGVMNSVK